MGRTDGHGAGGDYVRERKLLAALFGAAAVVLGLLDAVPGVDTLFVAGLFVGAALLRRCGAARRGGGSGGVAETMKTWETLPAFDREGRVLRHCCASYVGLDHLRGCPFAGQPWRCQQGLPPFDFTDCALCPEGTCRWQACEKCGGPIAKIGDRPWGKPRYAHIPGVTPKHPAAPRDAA